MIIIILTTTNTTNTTLYLLLYTAIIIGKIAERRWYERNKHIFPASRWELYDPKVNRDGQGYTIHGGEINHNEKK